MEAETRGKGGSMDLLTNGGGWGIEHCIPAITPTHKRRLPSTLGSARADPQNG